MADLKLGKRPYVASNRDFKFENYVKPESVQTDPPQPQGPGCLTWLWGLLNPPPPPPVPPSPNPYPEQFGHEALIEANQWQMLGNDSAGDCVLAGGDHEHMLWTREGGQGASFTSANALADYSAITGYNPADPSTDQGTEVRTAMSYRRKTGLVDASGQRHLIGAYLSINPADFDHICRALYWFGAVGIGFNFPDSAMSQFDNGLAWDVVPGAKIEGGHYVPLVALRGKLVCVTWGRQQAMTWQFFSAYCDEAWVAIDSEVLVKGKSPEGFDLDQLQADLNGL